MNFAVSLATSPCLGAGRRARENKMLAREKRVQFRDKLVCQVWISLMLMRIINYLDLKRPDAGPLWYSRYGVSALSGFLVWGFGYSRYLNFKRLEARLMIKLA